MAILLPRRGKPEAARSEGDAKARATVEVPSHCGRRLYKLGPLSEVEDVIGAVLYLASDAASPATGPHL